MTTMDHQPEDPVTEWYFWVEQKKTTIKERVKQMFSRLGGRKK